MVNIGTQAECNADQMPPGLQVKAKPDHGKKQEAEEKPPHPHRDEPEDSEVNSPFAGIYIMLYVPLALGTLPMTDEYRSRAVLWRHGTAIHDNVG